MDFNESNERPNFMKTDYSETKYDKTNELDTTMSIQPNNPDEVTRYLKTLGGRENA